MGKSPLLADFIHTRACKPICAKLLTLPGLSLDIDFPEYSFLVSEGDWEQSAEAPMERYLSVGEVFEKSKTIQYIYDVGEYWLHQIVLATWLEDSKNSPVNCILMTDVVPPENVAESKW